MLCFLSIYRLIKTGSFNLTKKKKKKGLTDESNHICLTFQGIFGASQLSIFIALRSIFIILN